MADEMRGAGIAQLVDYLDGHPGAGRGELAAFLGTGTDAVRARIDAANASLAGAARIEAGERGFCLAVLDEDAFALWRRNAGDALWDRIPETRRERISFLVSDLLSREGWVTVEALAKTLFCSRRTVVYDLQGVEEYLAMFDLALERRPRYGVRVVGTEVKRRICLANNALDRMAEDGELEGEPCAGAAVDGDVIRHNFRLETIARCVDEAIEKLCFTVNSVAYQNLLVHIAIAVQRIRLGRYAAGDLADAAVEAGDPAWDVARQIAANISQAFSIELPEGEIAYLAIHLAGKRVQLPGEPGDSEGKGSAISDEAWEVAGLMIAAADAALGTDLACDLELHMNLARHVGPLSVRLRYHMRLDNPLLQDIRSRYPFAFACALEAARVLAERYEVPVSDDETGYVALAFALALERRRARQARPKNVLVVCASGRGSARLLAMRCREEFGPQLGQIKTCDVSQVAHVSFDDIDYVFTTVPLPDTVPVPVREVGYFLDTRDVAGVQELFRSGARTQEAPWFDRRLFLPHLACATADEVISTLCRHVSSIMPVSGDLEELVRRREQSATTAYGNLVAMPHPLTSVTERTFVCAGLLDEPVMWGDRPVQVVLLLCVSDDVEEDLHDFYRVMLSFIGSREAVERLLADQRFDTLLDVMGCLEDAPTSGEEV